MRIGLLGFGTVGKGVYELVSNREDMEVAAVLCRRDLEVEGGSTSVFLAAVGITESRG